MDPEETLWAAREIKRYGYRLACNYVEDVEFIKYLRPWLPLL